MFKMGTGMSDSTFHQLDRSSPVFVAGHRGLVGSAIVRHLEREGFTNILTATRDQLDLRSQALRHRKPLPPRLRCWLPANLQSR